MNTEQNRNETDGKRPRFLKGIYRRTREGVEVLIVEKQNQTKLTSRLRSLISPNQHILSIKEKANEKLNHNQKASTFSEWGSPMIKNFQSRCLRLH